MTDIFISYARNDREIAADLAARLHEEDGWEIFWDRKIEAGAAWSSELQRRLESARCVLVLWSRTSRKSLWVQGEAAAAFERDVYLPVCIDDAGPPRLFREAQALSIEEWVADRGTTGLDQLRQAIESRIGSIEMQGSLDKVADGEPVTPSHLHLIHSCWRVDRNTRFGNMPYRIHLIVFGHHSATARIDSVEYHLPGYPEEHRIQKGGPAERLFELKELANGFCLAQAHVKLRDQPAGHPKVIRLSRLVNMSESGPRLLDDFVRRRKPDSRLGSILKSLPAAESEAERLLKTYSKSEAIQRLINEGYRTAMAESAVATAMARISREK